MFAVRSKEVGGWLWFVSSCFDIMLFAWRFEHEQMEHFCIPQSRHKKTADRRGIAAKEGRNDDDDDGFVR